MRVQVEHKSLLVCIGISKFRPLLAEVLCTLTVPPPRLQTHTPLLPLQLLRESVAAVAALAIVVAATVPRLTALRTYRLPHVPTIHVPAREVASPLLCFSC